MKKWQFHNDIDGNNDKIVPPTRGYYNTVTLYINTLHKLYLAVETPYIIYTYMYKFERGYNACTTVLYSN